LKGVRVDGGMVVDELLMQFQADILNRDVIRPVVQETTALGAAYAAGLAVGFYSGIDELCAKWQSDRAWKPQMAQPERERFYQGWKKAVTRSFDWAV
jgi:glycerol kinase